MPELMQTKNLLDFHSKSYPSKLLTVLLRAQYNVAGILTYRSNTNMYCLWR